MPFGSLRLPLLRQGMTYIWEFQTCSPFGWNYILSVLSKTACTFYKLCVIRIKESALSLSTDSQCDIRMLST